MIGLIGSLAMGHGLRRAHWRNARIAEELVRALGEMRAPGPAPVRRGPPAIRLVV